MAKLKTKTNRGLKIVLITNIFVLLAAAMLAPIYAVYVQKIGGDLLDVGLAAALFAAVAGVTSLVSGALADRVKRKYILVGIGYMLTGVGFLCYLLVTSVWQLFALQVFIGLVQASYEPVFDGLYSKFVGGTKHASSRWSFWEAGNYFSISIGSLAGAAIVTFWGFELLFVAMALLCFVSAAYVLMLPRLTPNVADA